VVNIIIKFEDTKGNQKQSNPSMTKEEVRIQWYKP
jgi:hypothetical protein